MAKHQLATIEFSGGVVEVITQFWVPDAHVIDQAREKLGPIAELVSDFKVAIRRPLNVFEEYVHSRGDSHGR